MIHWQLKFRKLSTYQIWCRYKYPRNKRRKKAQIDGLVQDCIFPIADALEMLQSCIKPSTCTFWCIAYPSMNNIPGQIPISINHVSKGLKPAGNFEKLENTRGRVLYSDLNLSLIYPSLLMLNFELESDWSQQHTQQNSVKNSNALWPKHSISIFSPCEQKNKLEISRRAVAKPLSFIWLCTWMSVDYLFVTCETINFFELKNWKFRRQTSTQFTGLRISLT